MRRALEGALTTVIEKTPRYLPALALLLSCLAWFAAFGFLGTTLGDPYHEDPEEFSRILERIKYLRIAYFSAFISLLVISAWISGIVFQSARVISCFALGVHGVMVFALLIIASTS